MNLLNAVPELFDMSVFYKMADGCRPEVENDVISCQEVEDINVVYILIFGEPVSRRSKNI